jgi:3-methyladenine DNA glycosylase AlkD
MMAKKEKITALLNEIRTYCRKHADDAVVAKYQRYFTEGYDAYGLTQEQVMQQRDVWLEQYKEPFGLDGFLAVGDLLLESEKYEEASFALLFVESFQDDYDKTTFEHMGKWLENGIVNWGHTDYLCTKILPPFWAKKLIKLNDLKPWKRSASKWQRRAVPVSMLDLLKTSPNYDKLLDMLDSMMEDEEKFVQQGLGWFLREAWKKQPEPVEAFLHKWKETAPRKIYQYATEKMAKEKKEEFRRPKR